MVAICKRIEEDLYLPVWHLPAANIALDVPASFGPAVDAKFSILGRFCCIRSHGVRYALAQFIR